MTALHPPHRTPWTRPETWFLAVCFLAVLFLRTALAAWTLAAAPQAIATADTASYLGPARALRLDHRYATQPGPAGEPELVRTPGYPVFLALHHAAFGEHPAPVLLTQALLGACGVFLLYALARRLCGHPAAVLAVLWYVADLNAHYTSVLLITETLFSFLLLGALWVLVDALEGTGPPPAEPAEAPAPPAAGRVAWAAVLFSAATLVRPILYYLLPLPALLLAVWPAWRLGVRGRLRLALAWCLPVLLLIGGWHLRNQRVAGYGGFAGIQHANLLLYRAAGVLMYRDHIPFHAAHELMKARAAQFAALPPPERWAHWDALAQPILRQHPLLVLRTMLYGLRQMLFNADDSGLYQILIRGPWREDVYADLRSLAPGAFCAKWWSDPVLRPKLLFSLAHMLPLYGACLLALLAMPAVVRQMRAGRLGLALCLLLLVYQVVIPAGPEAYARFRVPFAPLLYLFAAAGALRLVRHRRAGPA